MERDFLLRAEVVRHTPPRPVYVRVFGLPLSGSFWPQAHVTMIIHCVKSQTFQIGKAGVRGGKGRGGRKERGEIKTTQGRRLGPELRRDSGQLADVKSTALRALLRSWWGTAEQVELGPSCCAGEVTIASVFHWLCEIGFFWKRRWKTTDLIQLVHLWRWKNRGQRGWRQEV